MIGKVKNNSEYRFVISAKNELNHPRGFFGNKHLQKNIFFLKNLILKSHLRFSKKKPKFSRKTIHKSPRGWLSSFLALITNLYSELLFTLLIMRLAQLGVSRGRVVASWRELD